MFYNIVKFLLYSYFLLHAAQRLYKKNRSEWNIVLYCTWDNIIKGIFELVVFVGIYKKNTYVHEIYQFSS